MDIGVHVYVYVENKRAQRDRCNISDIKRDRS